ncbi:serine rich and transmembrane domain containing 1 isoform X1 [Acanthopagrus latus]|uniref:serine rich and transmembrane domain containing 1 isoform X1 n=2 Tax=Acanthopagrus latus TaxID=8177 RepID=UPI00187CE107|nr:serine rich and transmembrane domain containing 1 isoform X1 [Acanthopagrus latus]
MSELHHRFQNNVSLTAATYTAQEGVGGERREQDARMSGMDVLLVDHNDTALPPADNGTFLRFSPTSASTSAAASSPGRPGNVYVYVWLFLGLLVFLLTLLIISLHRLKNIISSSSSVPDCSSEGGSSFTNMEICSISSQRSTMSSLST